MMCEYAGCKDNAVRMFEIGKNKYNYCEKHFNIVKKLYSEVIIRNQ